MKDRITVIIPAHNEVKTLPKVIQGIRRVLEDEYHYRILVVDDGSTDNTGKVALENGAEVARHSVAMGSGGALKTGYLMAKECESDYILQLDADGQHDPSDFEHLFDQLKSSGADMVVGSRFLNGAPKISFTRKIGIVFFSWLVNKLTGYEVTDITSGFRVFRKESLDKLMFRAEKHWSIEMTMLAGVNGLKIIEGPMKMIDRKEGNSQFQEIITFMLYPLRAIKQILTVYMR
jgi:glycosyltransferase involved in cell wall biosynthesis